MHTPRHGHPPPEFTLRHNQSHSSQWCSGVLLVLSVRQTPRGDNEAFSITRVRHSLFSCVPLFINLIKHVPRFTHAGTHADTHTHTHTPRHTQTHTQAHTQNRTETHTHTPRRNIEGRNTMDVMGDRCMPFFLMPLLISQKTLIISPSETLSSFRIPDPLPTPHYNPDLAGKRLKLSKRWKNVCEKYSTRLHTCQLCSPSATTRAHPVCLQIATDDT